VFLLANEVYSFAVCVWKIDSALIETAKTNSKS
jgi:hypothetical protein